jgi:radical SAM superfamily enzyme YgiQ (UPF0313 family)
VLDLCFRRDTGKALKKALTGFSPELIGITLRNIDNAFYPLTISYAPFYKEAVNLCRRFSDAPIVLGGSAFTIMRRSILEYLGADMGVVGECEEAFPWLLDNLNDPRALESASWLIRKGEEGRAVAPAPMEKPLDELSLPSRELFPHRLYSRWGGTANIQTKRGCAFNCVYCTYPLIEGSCVRMRHPVGVVDEMEHLVKGLGEKRLFIVDSVFNNPPEHAELICAEILRRNLKFSWSCFATPGLVTEGLARIMARAGCTGLELGTDAAHAGMLSNLGKNFGVEDVVNATKVCRAAGLEVCHTLLFGGPGETPESIKATCEVMDGLDATAIIALTGVRVYPHTPLADTARKDLGISAEESFPEPVFYISPAVKDFMLDYLVPYTSERGRWVLPGVTPPIKTGLHRVLRGLGFRLPLWELLKYRLFRNRRKFPGLKLP